jgi:hypothetical protein
MRLTRWTSPCSPKSSYRASEKRQSGQKLAPGVVPCAVRLTLVGGEGEVADKEGLGGLADLVAESPLALLSVGLLSSGSGVVDPDRTAVNLLAVLRHGLGRGLEVGELDVGESLGSVVVVVPDHTGRDDLAALGKLGLEPVVVDVPRETADKDVARGGQGVGVGVDSVGLGLLCGGLGVVIGLSLAYEGSARVKTATG